MERERKCTIDRENIPIKQPEKNQQGSQGRLMGTQYYSQQMMLGQLDIRIQENSHISYSSYVSLTLTYYQNLTPLITKL